MRRTCVGSEIRNRHLPLHHPHEIPSQKAASLSTFTNGSAERRRRKVSKRRYQWQRFLRRNPLVLKWLKILMGVILLFTAALILLASSSRTHTAHFVQHYYQQSLHPIHEKIRGVLWNQSQSLHQLQQYENKVYQSVSNKEESKERQNTEMIQWKSTAPVMVIMPVPWGSGGKMLHSPSPLLKNNTTPDYGELELWGDVDVKLSGSRIIQSDRMDQPAIVTRGEGDDDRYVLPFRRLK